MDGNLSSEGLAGFDYDPRNPQYPCGRVTYPIPMAGDASRRSASTIKRSTTPLQIPSYDQPIGQLSQQQPQAQAYIPDWRLERQAQSQLGYQFDGSYPSDPTYTQQYLAAGYTMPYQTSPIDYVSAQSQYDSTLAMGGSYVPMTSYLDGGMPFDFQDFSNELLYPIGNGLPDMTLAQQNLSNSPTDTSLEVRSLSSSDNGWIELPRHSFDGAGSYQAPQFGAIFNPEETLHGRTFSDSSCSDVEQQSHHSWSSWVDVPQHAIGSPSSDSMGEMDPRGFRQDCTDQGSLSPYIKQEKQPQPNLSTISTSSGVKPLRIKTSSSPQRSPTSTGRVSPPGRRQPKKNPNSKATKPTTRRPPSLPKVDTEKRIGKRTGPLRPEQRKQAGEIRKLGACLRCKFLKKTCDKGEPCWGCQPSHARLWQVPCTRIDIKDIAYFMNDWRADCERHVSLEMSVKNIRGYSNVERTMFITHGYGHMLPIQAREVYVRDERCFGLDWVETIQEVPTEHSVNTAKLVSGNDGINKKFLDEYLDRYIDGDFEMFVDEYFEGTPFLTQMLKTAYRYWQRDRISVIRKCMKLLLAYNLTQHVAMVEGIPDEEGFLGKIDDPTSKFCGRTVAPMMINFEIKCAMADMWRELQKEILEELSTLYSRFYGGKDKSRLWPTIFMVSSILLAVWEEMQFDCHYRVPDKEVVYKFCNDMEATPVGVIVGLFSTISCKNPSFQEWSTSKHHTVCNSNPAVCDAMEEIRHHVTSHDKYLRSRCETSFDRDDFDSLAGKFTSQLVIRASAC